jgi:signal transduction histidine kinase/DNA-binding response OmpR family regulator
MLAVAVLFSIYITRMEHSIEESTQNHLRAVALAATTFVTYEELDLFHTVEDMNRPEWDEIKQRLDKYAEDYHVLYVYYWRYFESGWIDHIFENELEDWIQFIIDGDHDLQLILDYSEDYSDDYWIEYIYKNHDDGWIQYIIDNDFDEEYMVSPELVFPVSIDPTTSAAVPVVMKGSVWVADLGNYTSNWDGLISAVAPMYNSMGYIVVASGVDLSDEMVIDTKNIVRIMRTALVITLILSIVSGFFGMRLYRKKAIQSENASFAKSSFLSTMSHEIRTPINAILGITDIELINETHNKNLKESFGKIKASGDMLLGIINDILDLSKIESGKLELVHANYEIASLICDTAQLNMMRIGHKPIEFELDISESVPSHFIGDELRIKQILNNVLSNAFKYTNEGTVKMSITSKPLGLDKEELIFSISDTGQGMTQKQIDKLFDEYSRFNLEANRTTEGTGLGMSITRNLVEMMHGQIIINSEPGKGTTFIVQLPQTKIGTSKLGKESADNLNKFRTSNIAQLTNAQIEREYMSYGSVLIVDDVETNLYVANGLMQPYGLKIELADSGYLAIDKIKKNNVYDIIFMDHMMPHMDGIEAVKNIRELGYIKPIIALTANAVTGQSDIFLENGFDDFISKPIDVRLLNELLNKYIRNKQSKETIDAARAEKEQRGKSSFVETVQSGISPEFAKIFIRDAQKSMEELEDLAIKTDSYDDNDLRTYTIHVHGMKSALSNIGYIELSQIARNLENYARLNDIDSIINETPAFLVSLRKVVHELSPNEEEETVIEATQEELLYLSDKLAILKSACEDFNEELADKILSEIKEKPFASSIKSLIDEISVMLLHSDFDEIVALVDEYLR